MQCFQKTCCKKWTLLMICILCSACLSFAQAAASGRPHEKLYHAIIMKACRQHSVDPDLIKAIIKAESGFDSRALSTKGAGGLMQLMPRTALELGVSNVFDPQENIEAGIRYFKRLRNRFKGDTLKALAAYHAGAGSVIRYQGIPPFAETRLYIRRVITYRAAFKHALQIHGEDL